MSENDTDKAPGSSLEQQQAEDLMIELLAKTFGGSLTKKRFQLPAGGWLEIDRYCDSPPILREAWAHIGKPKSAQKFKVMADAIPVSFLELAVMQQLRQQTVVNRIVLVLDELPKKIMRHLASHLAGVNFNRTLQFGSLRRALGLGSPSEAQGDGEEHKR